MYEDWASPPQSWSRRGPCAELEPEIKTILEDHKYIPLPFDTKHRVVELYQEKLACATFRVSHALWLLLWSARWLIPSLF